MQEGRPIMIIIPETSLDILIYNSMQKWRI